MNRDAAIEAGARTLWGAMRHYPEIDWQEANAQGHPGVKFCRRQSAAVIDAALPHIAPRPERVVKAEAVREWAADTRAAYPEFIFIPPAPERLRQVHEFCKQSGGTLDAISAHVMRHAALLAEVYADAIERGEP